jgi:hypothetical protein
MNDVVEPKSELLAEAISNVIFDGRFEDMTFVEVLGCIELVKHRFLEITDKT